VAFVSYPLSQAVNEREWSLPGITGPSTTHRYWAISLPRIDAEALVASGSLIGAGFAPACRLPRSRVARVALYKRIHARLVQAEHHREAETRDIVPLVHMLERAHNLMPHSMIHLLER
jgi:hypothetical protein